MLKVDLSSRPRMRPAKDALALSPALRVMSRWYLPSLSSFAHAIVDFRLCRIRALWDCFERLSGG